LTPVGEFRAHVTFISDASYAALAVDDVLSCMPEEFAHTFLFIVDHVTLSQPDHLVLVVDLWSQRGRRFRVVPTEMWSVENNLSISNMGFEEFADVADANGGIFRGF
jgi:hypothetical protein